MKNIILIAKREFFTQVKKKSFIILTLLTPLLIIVFGGLVSLMFQANEGSKYPLYFFFGGDREIFDKGFGNYGGNECGHDYS